jgi:hypothetical protein
MKFHACPSACFICETEHYSFISHLSFLKGKEEQAYEITFLSVCLFPNQLLNQLVDLYEIQ